MLCILPWLYECGFDLLEIYFFVFYRKLEAQRRKERTEAHLYMTIQVVTEDQFYGHQGNDLFDFDRIRFK